MASFKDSLSFIINLKERVLFIYFKTMNQLSPNEGDSAAWRLYRLRLPLFRLGQIWKTKNDVSKEFSFFIILDSPAVYHRQLQHFELAFQNDTSWRESDTWYRQASLSCDFPDQTLLPTNFNQSEQVVDIGGFSFTRIVFYQPDPGFIGRWNVFRITLPTDPDKESILTLIHEIFEDYNIQVEDGSHFQEARDRPEPVWRWIDPQAQPEQPESPRFGGLADQNYVHLPFTVRYQLEVCISQGHLSEFTMTRDFVDRLVEMGESKVKKILEYVAGHKAVYYNPMDIFDLKVLKGVTDSKIPDYCCFMRTARITPTTIYYNTPTVDISNRVTRRYREHSDRFLRVRFTDDKPYGRIMSAINDTNNAIFDRVKQTMVNGITIGDRHYEFLAFGNSQFREHGAYFFAPTPDLSAADIRAWMGEFQHIRNIAKYTARLGQCFSTTRAIRGCPAQVKKCPDIVRASYCFSDGVGKISKFLAAMATEELNIRTPNGDSPSAFQFRLGGCKGMLAVSSDPQPHEVHIRPSQHKFDSGSGGLEIIRWSQFSIATLNRQLILVLSALGIQDKVFRKKLNRMLRSFTSAMNDDARAVDLLQKFVDPNQMTLVLAQMVKHGFRRTSEPFVISMLTLWKAWHLKYLKEKAKIVIDKGATLLGILDETGTLQGHFHSAIFNARALHGADREPALPEVFVQISTSDKHNCTKIIEGPCILARNPSLHPGDIRVVRAVNRPQLRHLVDVIVFPQTGDRDIPSMCSGGDLDGDDYLIIWDQELIPPEWFSRPMRYISKKAADLPRDVTVDDITSFFVSYMKTDCLPRIAHAHMAWADRLDNGVREDKCIRLAQLHSDAVDYIKTGGVTPMTRDLEPRTWPHFMEKKGRASYHSKRILGQLYDAVKIIDFVPNITMPFDSRILNCDLVSASESCMDFAKELKSEYDAAMRRVMAQHEIGTEFEICSSFVLSHNFLSRDYKLHEHLGSIASNLRNGFREQCFDFAGGRTIEHVAPLVVAMYRVTQQEMSKAIEERKRVARGEEENADEKAPGYGTPPDDEEGLPLISFPWIFHEFLGKIATGQYERSRLKEVKPCTKPTGKIYTQAEVQTIIAEMEGAAWDPSEKKDRIVPKCSEPEEPAQVIVSECPSLKSDSEAGVDQISVSDFSSHYDSFINASREDDGESNSSTLMREEDDGQAGTVVNTVEKEGDQKPSVLDRLLSLLNGS